MKPTERAFVVQFDPIPSGRRRLRGRAEVVASGEATHFRSLKELVDFMVGILRRRREPEMRSDAGELVGSMATAAVGSAGIARAPGTREPQSMWRDRNR